MNILKTLNDTIVSVLKRRSKADPIDKNDILNLIDDNLILLQLVVDSCESNADLFSYLRINTPANSENMVLYRQFVAELNTVAKRQEDISMLRSIYLAAKCVQADHQAIRDNFATLFNDGTDVAEITLEQMKLSHAALFGFINLSNLMADWFCFFLGSFSWHTGEAQRVPPYRQKFVANSSALVADFVNDVLLRGATRSILDVVKNIRQAGDVALYTSASRLDTYANINDYPGVSRLLSSFNVFQPILLVREHFTELANRKYKRNLAMRDWMITRMTILRMDMNKIDPESPDYKRQVEILQRYSNLLAELDKKIAQYENS